MPAKRAPFRERGATIVEYAILISAIGVGSAAAYRYLATSTSKAAECAGSALDGNAANCGGAGAAASSAAAGAAPASGADGQGSGLGGYLRRAYDKAAASPHPPDGPKYAFNIPNAGAISDATGPIATAARYIQGPWYYTKSVHETLAMRALRDALAAGEPSSRPDGLLAPFVGHPLATADGKDADVRYLRTTDEEQFVWGSRWPDDPEGNLFANPITTRTFSTGWVWSDEAKAAPEDPNGNQITRRSHNGNLVFLHAMAPAHGEAAAATKARMLNWLSFMGEVAAGRIPADTTVAGNPYLHSLFPTEDMQNVTVRQLLSSRGNPANHEAPVQGGATNDPERRTLTDRAVRLRAAGAMTHTIMDSFTDSHAERNANGEIVEFHFYGDQNSSLHQGADGWQGGNNVDARIRNPNFIGGAASVDRTATLLRMIDRGASKEEIRAYLDNDVLKLAQETRGSGPGALYDRNRQ